MTIHLHNRTLGIRAEPGAINWAVLDGTLKAPLLYASGTEVAPAAYGEASALAWLRQKLLHILELYKPTGVAVRYPEPTAKGANKNSARERCRVEGVVLEAAGTRNLDVVTGANKTISKNLMCQSAKDYLDSDDFRGMELSKYKKYVQEAIIVAASILIEG